METLLDHWKKFAGGGLLATGTVASLAYVTGNALWRGVWVTLAVVLLLALLTFLAWVAYRRLWVRRRRNQVENAVPVRKFGYEAVTGEEADIRTDEMKDSLAFGVERLRELGMDLYELPWYLVMGYSSAGKSFVCQSLAKRIGTPEGMNKPYRDELEGTYNLDWWFYNDAVFIDTAGRIAFQETPEWTTMLHGLRKARKDCPINGVFLVVGADELSKESDDELYERAKQLRKQLDSVKLKLQIRFPVYVIVTKGDLIEGFSEFFKDLPTQEKRDQIIGWSNGKDLDATVIRVTEDHGADSDAAPDPDYFNSILTPLKRWRMSAMAGSTPGGPVAAAVSEANYQLDNVDDGYGFPEALRESMRRLDRVYLQTIFGDRLPSGPADSDEGGSQSARPRPGGSAYTRHRARMRPFLRGIYLSSSRQGAPVNFDDDDRLESGSPKAATDRRIYFLKDLVLRKIFPERNLVTPDESISLGRKRLVLTASVSIACAILIALIFSFVLSRGLDEGVNKDLDNWRNAAELSKRTDLLSRLQTSAQPVSGSMSLLAFHEHLYSAAAKGLDVPAVFLPFKLIPRKNVDRERREAQRVLLGEQIVSPLVQEVRRKLESAEEKDRVGTRYLKNVLLDLIALESGDHRVPSSLITNSLVAIGAVELSAIEAARSLANSTYANGGWPPENLLQGSSSQQREHSILAGVEKYLREVQENAKGILGKQDAARKLHSELKSLSDLENQIYGEMSRQDLGAELKRLRSNINGVDDLVRNAGIADSITNGMVGIFKKLDDEFIGASRPEIVGFHDSLPPRPASLVNKVKERLESGIKGSNSSAGSLLSNPAEEEANRRLDGGWLALGTDGKYAYGTRAKILFDMDVRQDGMFGIGTGFSNYFAWVKELNDAFSAQAKVESQLQFKRLTNFLFQSRWDKGVQSRWSREYASGPGGVEAMGSRIRVSADKLRNDSSCSLGQLSAVLQDVRRFEQTLQGAQRDRSVFEAQVGRFVGYQQEYLRKLFEDVGKAGDLSPSGTINILGYASGKLRSPLGKGLPPLSGDDIFEERRAYSVINSLLAEKSSGIGKLIEESRFGLKQNLGFALATLKLMSDDQGVTRQCRVSYDKSADAADPSGFQRVYSVLEIGSGPASVRFNRLRNDEGIISADSRLKLRGFKGNENGVPEPIAVRIENEVLALSEWSLFQILSVCRADPDAAPDAVRVKVPTDRDRNIYLRIQFVGAGPAVGEWLKLKQETK